MSDGKSRKWSVVALLILLTVAVGGGLLLRRTLRPRRAMLAPDVVARHPIVPGVAIGPVRVGMTQEQVVALLGKPDSVAASRNWQYRDPDLAVLWDRANPPTAVMIFGGGWPNLTNVPYRTVEGIGLGSTVADVTAAWGPPERESDGTLGYPSRGITVMHKDGQVVWLAVRTPVVRGASQPATLPVADPPRGP